jgi:hypothetical protein
MRFIGFARCASRQESRGLGHMTSAKPLIMAALPEWIECAITAAQARAETPALQPSSAGENRIGCVAVV